MRFILACLAATISFWTPAHAEGREALGFGRVFSNDYFGDGSDRWQTASSTLSYVRGRAPYFGNEAFGDLLEFQLRGQIISPSNHAPAPGDRPYVGALSFGVATHFDLGGTDLSLGAGVTAIGPQTGLSAFQTNFHETFDIPGPRFVDDELGDDVFVNANAAATRVMRLSDHTTVRPFVEAHFGTEDLVRAGADVLFGTAAQNDLLLRDVVTGQLYRGTIGDNAGVSLLLGADTAKVFDSAFLPAEIGYNVSETRTRARAGVFAQYSTKLSGFYGVTYLSPEFEGQHEGQYVGSLRINFSF